MNKKKYLGWTLAAVIVAVFAFHPAVHAAADLEWWPVDKNATGDLLTKGQLTIYYDVVDGALCKTCVDDPIFEGEPMANMLFFIKFFEEQKGEWHYITGKSAQAYCLTYGAVTGEQQEALQAFLNGPVLDALNGENGSYTGVVMTKAKKDFENLSDVYDGNWDGVYPLGVVATVKMVAQPATGP